MKSLGDEIKRLRIVKGLSQREFAEALRISQPMVSQLQNGKCLPSIFLIYHISDILGVSVEHWRSFLLSDKNKSN
jgi:transcriptional regulator with XRE-family HTH domain